MRKTLRFFLAGLWILLATGFLTRWWLTSLSAEILPKLPEAFWTWLILDVFGDANRKGDAAILVGLCLSFLVVSLSTLFVWFLWRYVQNALTTSSKRRQH